jgi:hypothetical protein
VEIIKKDKNKENKMKITLSKGQWEKIGNESGWIKSAQTTVQVDKNLETIPNLIKQMQQAINGVLDPKTKQSLNTIIAQPLNNLTIQVQQIQQQQASQKQIQQKQQSATPATPVPQPAQQTVPTK